MTDSQEAGRTKNNAPVQIMLVEDNPGDVHLLELSLRSRNIVFDLILHFPPSNKIFFIALNTKAFFLRAKRTRSCSEI